ncbi:DALR anticodon-binding domain-containing protein [Pseudofrankia saprophytica]|uniref:DALR anticodon-binding domain-containing protein n=1 Tax=Pseudofrankia saprophytica TaxID=298655 RepID=UPI000234CB37|nr:DALR anticodon-binding domain-containing protein [Pseudofrankia saprophytica]
MTPADVADAIVSAVRDAVADGAIDVAVPATVPVRRPKNSEHGDYASVAALEIARAARRPAREVADLLAARLCRGRGIASVEVAGPGFLNIRLAPAALGELARTVVRAGDAYGRAETRRGIQADAAFAAASCADRSPFAPARRLVAAAALARLLDAAGFDVSPAGPADQAGAAALADLAGVVGTDAARYSLARQPLDAPLDLDLALVGRQVPENPAFDVRYAHAETCRLLRHATQLGIPAAGGDVPVPGGVDVSLLGDPREVDLLRALGELPSVLAAAASSRAPHRLARYLEELAGTYHRFYDACRVLPRGDEEPTPLTRARLLLVEATKVVLANGLRLLCVRAPERL